MDIVQQLGAELVEKYPGAVVHALGEDESGLAFLGLATREKNGFDVVGRSACFFDLVVARVLSRRFLLKDRSAPRRE